MSTVYYDKTFLRGSLGMLSSPQKTLLFLPLLHLYDTLNEVLLPCRNHEVNDYTCAFPILR